MLTDAPFHPSLAVADLAKARAWYSDRLGWDPILEWPGTHVFQVGESSFTLYESEFAGTAKNTVMNWSVSDVQTEVRLLRERGVTFEEYDFGEVKTVNGVMTDPSGGMSAWFKDLDGNIVGLISAGPKGSQPEPGSEISGMIAAADLDRAQRFYEGTLGFEPRATMPGFLASYRSGPSTFTVYRTEFAGTAKNTVGVWRFAGIRDEVARLRGRGVSFEEYDFGDGDKTVGGILSDAEGDVNAWFKDSEGNVLALAEDRA